MRPIRILIAEDSELFAEVISAVFDDEIDMEVVGIAPDGERAIDMCRELQPDLVLMDIQMPRMDGLSATQHIMADTPTPILVITSDPYHGGVDMSFKALSYGALDLMAKPQQMPWDNQYRREFLRKIRLLSQIPVIRHMRVRRTKHVTFHGKKKHEIESGTEAVVGVVASTGGPKAIARLLADLPPEFAAPIVIVQHIIRGFSAHLSSYLDKNSALNVSEARDGQIMESGSVYVAPADKHVEVGPGRRLHVFEGAPVGGHCPSGDLLLESVARYVGARGLGLVLSGMGSDGTAGLAALHRAGAVTLVQDRESCVVYGMPQSAIDFGVVSEVVKLDELARGLIRHVETIHQEHT